MEVLGAVLGPVVECIISPVGRQLGYLIFYKRNVKDLEKQLKNLQLARERVQILVREAKGISYAIYNDVSSWLVEVDAELQHQINEGGSNRNNDSNLWCPKLRVICYPRKIKKRVDNILKLIEQGNTFDTANNIGYSVPLPITKSTTLPPDYQILESRTSMAERIKDALADANVNKVGLSGMGGVGKTKLVDEVKKLVLESKLFDRVIVVTVGESRDVKSIQDQIEDKLNIRLEGNSEMGRASRLQTKIVEMKNNILIVLDDLWKLEYDLEKDIGIPCHLESRKEGYCKILITSRSQDLLTNQLSIENMFEVNPLDEKESWKFFVAIVGEFVEVGIEPIAKNVVKECGGLPLALALLAKVLKGKIKCIWNDILNKLKNHAFVDITGVGKHLYNCVKLSYDSIEDEEAKALFLMCSVFPDDDFIYVYDLQIYAMGMGMLNNINNWEDAMNRVMKLVDDLTSSCLLIYFDENHNPMVRMHDVIRDVAKHISSNIYQRPSLTYVGQNEWREEERRGSYYSIFVNYVTVSNLPPKLEFPNLQLLILKISCWKDTQIPNAFFEGVANLRVLDMKNVCFEPSRTSLTHSLNNLQALCLTFCKIDGMDTIGELQKLKILKIHDEFGIEELPANMSQLRELKVLKVINCDELKVIHPNIISSMKKLEELSLEYTFKSWGEEVSYKGKTIKNVKLSELNCLTQLSILRIEVQNVDMLSNELSLETVRKLQDFYISAGKVGIRHGDSPRTLRVDIRWKARSWESAVVETLMQRCEYLDVRTNSVGFTKVLFKENANHFYPRLKSFYITIDEEDSTHMAAPHDDEVQNITPFFATSDHHEVSFLELKELTISMKNNLEMLQHLWHKDWVTPNSFCKLQKVFIVGCNKLAYVFPSNMIKSLVSLNSLEVISCELVERIFEIEDSMDNAQIVVPLIYLQLSSLPNLKYVWSNDPGECLTFPNLRDVGIYACPRLTSIFPASFMKHMGRIETLKVNGEMELFAEDEASKLITTPEIVLFPNLTILEIHGKMAEKISFWHKSSNSFPKLQSLGLIGFEDDGMITLSLEMIKLVYTIKKFMIRNATELVQVFQNGEENEREAKLKSLTLIELPKLTRVWEDNNNQMTTSFDSLERIEVRDCVNLKCLLPSSITFSNLTELEVEKCNGLMSLFSSSVANKLVNLASMDIIRCEGMSSIVVVEGSREEEIVFKRLRYLELKKLPRLTSFHSGKPMLHFPCLVQLYIKGCNEMKTFSYGIISMPKLQFLLMKKRQVIPVSQTDDSNVILKNLLEVDVWRRIKDLYTQEGEEDREEDSEEDSSEEDQ